MTRSTKRPTSAGARSPSAAKKARAESPAPKKADQPAKAKSAANGRSASPKRGRGAAHASPVKGKGKAAAAPAQPKSPAKSPAKAKPTVKSPAKSPARSPSRGQQAKPNTAAADVSTSVATSSVPQSAKGRGGGKKGAAVGSPKAKPASPVVAPASPAKLAAPSKGGNAASSPKGGAKAKAAAAPKKAAAKGGSGSQRSFKFPRAGDDDLILNALGAGMSDFFTGKMDSDVVVGYYVAATEYPLNDGAGLIAAMRGEQSNHLGAVVDAWAKQGNFSRSAFSAADVVDMVEVVDTTEGDDSIVLARIVNVKRLKIPAPTFTFYLALLPCTFRRDCLARTPEVYSLIKRNLVRMLCSGPPAAGPSRLVLPLLGCQEGDAASKGSYLSSIPAAAALDCVFSLAEKARADFTSKQLRSVEVWSPTSNDGKAISTDLSECTLPAAGQLEQNVIALQMLAEDPKVDKEVRDSCRFIGASWDTCNFSAIGGVEALFTFVACIKCRAVLERWCRLRVPGQFTLSHMAGRLLTACLSTGVIPPTLHIALSDVINNGNEAAHCGGGVLTLSDANRSIHTVLQLMKLWTPPAVLTSKSNLSFTL